VLVLEFAPLSRRAERGGEMVRQVGFGIVGSEGVAEGPRAEVGEKVGVVRRRLADIDRQIPHVPEGRQLEEKPV
jgi:hypothetical protein